MDRELELYYENRFNLFAEQGWKDLIEDIDVRIAAIQGIKGIKDVETLFTRQGELDALEWLKSLPELSERAFAELTENK